MKKIKGKKAFTIVELVIVIAVIAILATVLVPTFGDVIGKAQESAAKQAAKNAFTGYLIHHPEEASGSFLYHGDKGFVILEKGVPTGVFPTEEEALTAAFDDPETQVDEGTHFALSETGTAGLNRIRRTKALIYASDFEQKIGAVSATNGSITVYTNNWYGDIEIPEGALQVRYLTFKTSKDFGNAFFGDGQMISGNCDSTTGGQWVTVDIPTEADVFRYGYLYDSVTEEKNLPKFEYVEFIGEDIHLPTQKMERPEGGRHTFSVTVNIAPALGQEGVEEAVDYGYIELPENYTKNGEPIRLVIICHGASAKLEDYKSAAQKNHSQSYWLDMGYAIMDMYACPPALGNGSELHYGNPAVLECYEKGYEYVMEHFNLKEDGIFVLGSSMGGLSSFQIVQSGKFPVLAQVANCPVIDLYKQAYCNPWTSVTYQRERIGAYFSFEGTKPTLTAEKHIPSNGEISWFRDNFEKVIPYSPIFAKVTSGNMQSIFDKLPANATVADAEEAALYAGLTATHPCPLLIIHNTNDDTVSYRYSEYFAGMLDRGGATVQLKLYSYGAHNAWDNGPKGQITGWDGTVYDLSESRRMAIEFFRQYEP